MDRLNKWLSKKSESQKQVDNYIVEGFKKLFPKLADREMHDPARSSLMAAISNLGTYAFGAYDDPVVEGFREDTTTQNVIRHLKWEWVHEGMEGVLKIHLIGAHNLRDADGIGKGHSDPYVVFSSGGSFVNSEVKHDTANPEYNSTHYLFLRKHKFEPELAKLFVTVYDQDVRTGIGSILNRLDKDDHIGEGQLDLERLKIPGIHNITMELKDDHKAKKKTATVRFSVQFISVKQAFDEMGKDENSDMWMEALPSDDEDNIKWSELTLMTDLGLIRVEPVAFIDATRTGTQAWIHINAEAQVVVVAFRGTEMNRLKDVLTDGKFFPSTFTATTLSDSYSLKPTTQFCDKNIKVHRGFKDAYDSIRESVFRICYNLTEWSNDWTICLTGHSLGGALATLCAFEMANRKLPLKHVRWASFWHALKLSHDNEASYACPKIGMMNFGAPRVGNAEFVRLYNETVGESLRVVNSTDLVHFLPPIFYQHTKYEVEVQADGEVILGGKTIQPGVVATRSMDGEEDGVKMVDRAFSRVNVASHLQPYYFQLVQAAVSKFFQSDTETRGRPMRVLKTREIGKSRGDEESS